MRAGIRGAPGGIRTPDTRFRRPMLCPLSYGSVQFAASLLDVFSFLSAFKRTI
jgi:hypothetical protein